MDLEDVRKRIDEEILKAKDVISDYSEMTKPISPDDSTGRIS